MQQRRKPCPRTRHIRLHYLHKLYPDMQNLYYLFAYFNMASRRVASLDEVKFKEALRLARYLLQVEEFYEDQEESFIFVFNTK